jgi:hypothetical protein
MNVHEHFRRKYFCLLRAGLALLGLGVGPRGFARLRLTDDKGTFVTPAVVVASFAWRQRCWLILVVFGTLVVSVKTLYCRATFACATLHCSQAVFLYTRRISFEGRQVFQGGDDA